MDYKDQLTKNFHISEFACKDGTPVPEKYYSNAKRLAKNLQVLRDYIGKPVNISGSGYRTEYYNDVYLPSIGYRTAKKSMHKYAKAADISVRDYTSRKLARTIKKLIRLGIMEQGGIGLYNSFVHYDIRNYKARWDKSSLFNF